MPPIRPGKLSCLAVTIVLGCVSCVLIGLTLGIGPVSVRTIGCLVTVPITVGPSMPLVEMLRNMLVFLISLLSACVRAPCVQWCPVLLTLLMWFLQMMLTWLQMRTRLGPMLSVISTLR